MMKPRWSVCLVLTLLAPAGPALAGETSPYSGLEKREIKALSENDVESLLSGKGMGFALAAELNAFPGPKHVIELANPLELDGDQIRATEAVYDRMHAEAVRLGEQVVDSERELEALFLAGVSDRNKLRATVLRIGELRAALRFAHLAAHVDMREILTEEQVRQYDALRGYEHQPREDCPHAGS